MELLKKVIHSIDRLSVKLWNTEDKTALLKIAYEIYNADNAFSEAEKAEFHKYAKFLGVSDGPVMSLSLGEAFELLKKDSKKIHLAYLWIAHAVFADESFTTPEKQTLDNWVKNYHLDAQLISAQIDRVRNKKLEEILEDWAQTI